MPSGIRIIPAVILAAGDGERMKSKKSKVTHDICGKSIVEWVLFNLEQAGINRKIVVAGFDSDNVLEKIGERADYVLQEERLGTAHALMLAMEKLNDHAGTLLVIYGSMPLV
ncbi:MAG: NTP transferase domain-containing protein, partial [Eubacteriales bacterium]|nr:NTP transferase domain-containing protein [Eubacteriales bacterium]